FGQVKPAIAFHAGICYNTFVPLRSVDMRDSPPRMCAKGSWRRILFPGKEERNMDQVKIGKFIAQMRKEQNLTQRGLADKLSISDKTVSKWERGVSHN